MKTDEKARKTDSIYAAIAADMIEALEAGLVTGSWEKPWISRGGLPINATTRKAYQGGNVVVLMVAAHLNGYGCQEWATFNQWKTAGAMVRKGEHGTGCIKWFISACKAHKAGAQTRTCRDCFMAPSAFTLFNADQVDGYEPEPVDDAGLSDAEKIEHAEAWFASIGSEVRHGGDSAHYAPVADYIAMPDFAQFTDPVSYYGTLAHEHVHWTGHSTRLDRGLDSFGVHFGSDKYGAEELVAELGSAFVAAYLGIEATTAPNHARYLKSWLSTIRAEPKALFEAAGRASKALEFLTTLAEPSTVNQEGVTTAA